MAILLRPIHLFVSLCVFVVAACGPATEEQDTPSSSGRAPETALRTLDDLHPGRFVEMTLTSGERHGYRAHLAAGETLRVIVEQRGVDVVVEVFDPVGQRLEEVDSPTENYGPELVCLAAEISGSYRLQVRPFKNKAGGTYELRVERLGPSTPWDRTCVEATRAFLHAQELRATAGHTVPKIRAAYEEARNLWHEAEQPYWEGITVKESCRLRSTASQTASCYEEALSLLRTARNRYQEVVVLNLLGLARRDLGEKMAARTSFELALGLAREISFPGGEAGALTNLALLEKSRGEHHQAIGFHRQALEIWRTLGDRGAEAIALHNLGVTYSELGKFDEALDLLRDALAIRLDGPLSKQASTLMARGWTYHLAGEDAAAIRDLEEAVERYRQVDERPGEAAALDRLGTALRELGHLEQSAEAYRQALHIVETLGRRTNIAHTMGNLGWLLLEQGHAVAAKDTLGSARTLLEQLDERDGVVHVLVGLAEAERALGDLASAQARFEEALTQIEERRHAARLQGRRVHPVSLWQDYAERYVDLLMERHQNGSAPSTEKRAFVFSDLVRNRNLYEMLIESRVDLRSGTDKELREREQAIRERLETTESQRRRLMATRAPADQIAALDHQLRELRLEFQELQADIRVRHPRFARLRSPQPVSLEEVQASLGSGTELVSFVLGTRRSFAFRVDSSQVRSAELPGRDSIEALAEMVYEGLRNSHERRARGQVETTVKALGELLFQALGERPQEGPLLVIPDGRLLYVPFAVLPWPEATGDPSQLLVDDLEIVYLPSVASLLALRQRSRDRAPPAGRVAVLADPVFSRGDSRLAATSEDADSDGDFDRLPWAHREAKAILERVLPEERVAALGFEAHFEFATNGILSGYRTLHFATHAVIDEDHPELSGLVLAQFDEAGRRRSRSHLRLHEIYSLDLPADLVVLSACRTALGQRRRGDALVGLTRGFFYAGASRLVVSLWDVDDEATAELMDRFYRGLLDEGLSPSAALRTAQLELRRDPRWRAPYFWAGFVLQGDWE